MGKLRDQPLSSPARAFYQGPPRSHLIREDPPVPAMTEALVLCTDMSADEYVATGVETNLPYELIEGVLTLNPPPSRFHQRAYRVMTRCIDTWVHARDLGEVVLSPADVRVDAGTVLQPDLLFLANGHPCIADPYRTITQPDLVIEIISPHGRRRDRIVKFELYARAAIPNYWMVDPESRSIEGYELTADQRYMRVHQPDLARFSAPPFPELVIDLDEVFGTEEG